MDAIESYALNWCALSGSVRESDAAWHGGE